VIRRFGSIVVIAHIHTAGADAELDENQGLIIRR
jgi:hypothetical protein